MEIWKRYGVKRGRWLGPIRFSDIVQPTYLHYRISFSPAPSPSSPVVPVAPRRPLYPPPFDSPALSRPLSSRGCPFEEGLAGRLAKYLLVITSKKGVFHSSSWNNRIPTFSLVHKRISLFRPWDDYYIQRCFLVEPEAAWSLATVHELATFLRYENTSLPHPTTWNNNVMAILCQRFGNLRRSTIFRRFSSSHPSFHGFHVSSLSPQTEISSFRKEIYIFNGVAVFQSSNATYRDELLSVILE